MPTPTGGVAEPLDFRPLGIGGAIMRLISTAVCSKEGSEVGKLMSPLQLDVAAPAGGSHHRRHLHHSGDGARDLHARAGGTRVLRHPHDGHQE